MTDKILTTKEGNDLPKPASESDAPVAPAVINPLEPEPEYWQYMGIDSTSPMNVDIVSIGDNDQESVNNWMCKIKKPEKGQSVNYNQVIQEGIELAKSIASEANRLINAAFKNFADRAIFIGLICLKLKALIRGDKRPWAVWAEENLPFIAKRNREKYMLLASRPDCWHFSFLGVDRLEMLCSVTRDMEGTNKISDLFNKYEIPFDDNMEINMSEFKSMIDAAINNERLKNNGLTINYDKIKGVTAIGVEFDTSLIKRLKDVRDCGGNPETLLDRIKLTGGREDMDVTPAKRLQDFNHLSNRLIVTLDFIMKDQDQLAKIDRDTFAALMAKLASIQELGILNEDEEKAA